MQLLLTFENMIYDSPGGSIDQLCRLLPNYIASLSVSLIRVLVCLLAAPLALIMTGRIMCCGIRKGEGKEPVLDEFKFRWKSLTFSGRGYLAVQRISTPTQLSTLLGVLSAMLHLQSGIICPNLLFPT